MTPIHEILLLTFLYFDLTLAYSFAFTNSPTQCGTVSVSITGSGGTPPYRLSLVPVGSSPLPIEVRRIMDMQFNGNSVDFVLPFPAKSQFVAVVSDNNGAPSNFGTGGASVPVTVQASSNTSCLPTSQVAPGFTIANDPLGAMATCHAVTLSWDGSKSQGDVVFYGIIPGGQSFVIPQGSHFTDQGQQAFSWTPDIKSGSEMIVVGGDARGFGSGGSFDVPFNAGNGDTSCIKSDSPTSTAGPPAGGSYPTDINGDLTIPSSSSVAAQPSSSASAGSAPSNSLPPSSASSSSPTSTNPASASNNGTLDTGASNANSSPSHDKNIGAIVGGVIGGAVGVGLIGLLVFCLLRRPRRVDSEYSSTDQQEQPPTRFRDNINSGGPGRLPSVYLSDPFEVPPIAPFTPPANPPDHNPHGMTKSFDHGHVPGAVAVAGGEGAAAPGRHSSSSSRTRESDESSEFFGPRRTTRNGAKDEMKVERENHPYNVYQHEDHGLLSPAKYPDHPPRYVEGNVFAH